MPRPWQTWDSAVVLLYLGAFLVVAAGLVYASYNWAALGGWQKVGLLAVATAAFIGGGLVLLPVARVRPAAETFVGIGAVLVPMNVLAVANVFAGARQRPALTLLLDALLVAGLYGLFAFRPGGAIYRYSAPAAVLLAVGALPPALGAGWGWGLALLTLVSAAAPDAPRWLGGRWRRFARPAVAAGLVALPVGGFGGVVAPAVGGGGWAAPAALAAAAVAVGRWSLRRQSDGVAALWTGVALAAAGAALWTGERPPADWAVAAEAPAAAGLLLAETGPRLARRPVPRTLLHAEAVALLVAAPAFALVAPDRPGLFTLGWVGATVGTAVVARRRLLPPLLALAAVFASVAYVSIGRWPPGEIGQAALPVAFAPIALGLAGSGVLLHRRLGGRRGRR